MMFNGTMAQGLGTFSVTSGKVVCAAIAASGDVGVSVNLYVGSTAQLQQMPTVLFKSSVPEL